MAIVTYVSSGPVLKALMMAALGLALASVGLDKVSGLPRFTLGIGYLLDGIPLALLSWAYLYSSSFIKFEKTLRVKIYEKR